MTCRLLWLMVVVSALGSSHGAIADERPSVCVVAEKANWSFRYLVNTLDGDDEFASSSMFIDGRGALGPALAKCSVLILVDVSPQAFRRQPEIVEPIAEFVAQGGGLIIASGDSWRDEEYPFKNLLPVQVGAGEIDEDDAPDLSRASITGAGLRSPILRLVDDPMRNQQLWRDELDACFGAPLPVIRHKAATVLAIDPARRIDGKKIPLIATRDVGEGRVIFLNNSQIWRWRTKPIGNYHGRFWKQLARYAAGQE